MLQEDFPQVESLWHRTEGMGLDPVMDSEEKILLYLQKNPGLSIIAESKGKVIGTVLSGTDGRRGYLMHLAVSEEYRRQGIANRLVETSLDKFKSIGILSCHIFVFCDNEEGARFWQETGWEKNEIAQMYSKFL